MLQVEALANGPGKTKSWKSPICFVPGNIAVSGPTAACERAAELAAAAGAMKAVPLAVAGAFHTQIMRPADERLAEALADVPMRRPRIPVVSNVDAQPHDDPEEIRQLLVRQVLQPVLWEDSMRYLLPQGFDRFYEVGPGRVLRGLLRRIDRKVECQSAAVVRRTFLTAAFRPREERSTMTDDTRAEFRPI